MTCGPWSASSGITTVRARIANEQKQQDRVPFGLAQGKRDDMFAARRTRQLQSKNVVQAAERRLYLGRHGVCPPHAGATECRLTLMLYELSFLFFACQPGSRRVPFGNQC